MTENQKIILNYLESLEHLRGSTVYFVDDEHLVCRGVIYSLDDNDCIVSERKAITSSIRNI